MIEWRIHPRIRGIIDTIDEAIDALEDGVTENELHNAKQQLKVDPARSEFRARMHPQL